MCFHYIPHTEESNVTASVSPVELAVRETVFIIYRPALRIVTQTCSVKRMNFIQDIISIFVYDNVLLILIVSFVTKYWKKFLFIGGKIHTSVSDLLHFTVQAMCYNKCTCVISPPCRFKENSPFKAQW